MDHSRLRDILTQNIKGLNDKVSNTEGLSSTQADTLERAILEQGIALDVLNNGWAEEKSWANAVALEIMDRTGEKPQRNFASFEPMLDQEHSISMR
ncbi:hypothetical protein [Neptuniibacter sp. QD37_11]|uniref:hypothetical protein n=1 Tax=Neptuniibacter sp. QD37_11 TaxID=3398209 RepID=UPI0039F504A6